MAHIYEVLPDDNEIEAMAAPKNVRAAKAMQHRREVRRRLEDCLERLQLRRALDLDEDETF
ncbi:hypothetical protein L9G15_11680 [Shewanella sp. A3A]|uniref:Uncharacterized protein n=1 Tax=Shewanella electrica TaxID=515560 RepID=A0ABT2FSB5_9GAMM|nr:hypothetical protein [Shewanella electrica]MCH1920093.1 hypothetical protein [Shewanella ferrihydritica]MCH1925628.1 hypothetical protein [Shewanella electrica]MCS4558124.1 hypothetical protein [Shewanella electrica]